MVDLDLDIDDVFGVPREGARTLSFGERHELAVDPHNPRIAIIRTSDRIAFKACRRRWGWSSHLRHNLGPRVGIGPLWFGTGIHFAMEDFHGYNRFGHPKAAFDGYVKASLAHRPDKLPDDIDELIDLGHGMMDYYILWLQQRKHSTLKTLWIDGVPQVEVNFRIRIPGDWSYLGYDEVWYSGTIDRVVVDEYGLIWPIDYKTAKSIEIMHYQTDPQISTYMWATPNIYPDYTVGGFKYVQFRKMVPNPGRLIYGGTKVSTAQNQGTSAIMYRQTLINHYGSVERSPEENQQFLNWLHAHEDENKDDFIQIDSVNRNDQQGQSEGAKILMEIEDMLNPDLPLYPNPTRFCASYNNPCPFLAPCVNLDDGSDWVHILEATTEQREAKYDGWRNFVTWPGSPQELKQIEDQAARTAQADRSWLDV